VSVYVVVISSIIVVALLGVSDPVRSWWRSLRTRPGPGVVLILAVATTFLGGSRLAAAAAGLEAASGIRLLRAIALLSLLTLASVGILRDTRAFGRAGSAAVGMLLYGLLAVSSAVYSLSPFISAWKGFEVVTVVVVGIYLGGRLRTLEDIQGLLDIVWLALLVLVTTALASVAVVPEQALVKLVYSPVSVLAGVYPEIHPNLLTQLAAIIAVVCLIEWIRPNRPRQLTTVVVVLGLSLAAALLAHSRTSLIAALIASLAVVYFSRHRALFWLAMVGGILLWAFSEAVLIYFGRGQSTETFLSMSGRTKFWPKVLQQFYDSPILGHGFYAAQHQIFGVSSVDNTYLEVLLGLGILGLVVFTLPALTSWYLLLKARPRPSTGAAGHAVWLQLMILLLFLTIRSLTGPSFQVMHPNLVLYMVAIVCINSFNRLRVEERTGSRLTSRVGPSYQLPKDFRAGPRRRRQIEARPNSGG